MFDKKCSGCGNKVKEDFRFCPFCSRDLRSRYEIDDYGFLGKDDFIEDIEVPDAFMEKMFNSAMKIFEKQLKNFHNERDNQKPPFSGLNVKFFINGERAFPDNNKQIIKLDSISKEKLKKLMELPKKEPKSKIKRLSGKLIYELYIPGVKSISDVLISRLENSIEIKAIGEDKIYLKNLKINLPILKYQLLNDILIIEMLSR